MSILNVNQIQPVGGGNTITVSASDVNFSGNISIGSSFVGTASTATLATISQGLTGTPDIIVNNIQSGVITATTFIGNGSGLTGVTASGSGINIKDSGSTVGVAATVDFGTNLNVSPASAGIVTVTVGDTDFEIVDKIVHTSDTDTALRFPAADTFSVETAGTERLRVTSGLGGNLLVGMSTVYNANATAQIKNGINIVAQDENGNVTEVDSAGEAVGRILFGDTRPGKYASIECIADGTCGTNDYPGRLVFRTTSDGTNSDAERMRISSNGDVKIGTTSNVTFGSRRALTVANGTTGAVISLYNNTTATANPRISSNPGGSEINDIGIHAASTNGNIIAYTNNDTERLRITSGGLVGIGTDNPLNGLDLNQSEGRFRVNRFSHLLMQNKNNSTTNYWGISTRDGGELDIGYGTPDGNSLIGGDKLTITSAGAFGLGITSPSSKAHIKGGSLTIEHLSPSTGTCQLNINSENNSQVSFSFDDQGHISFGSASTPHNQGSFSEKVRIQNGGGISFNGDTAQANALDDYEEGTLNWRLQRTGAIGSGSNNNDTSITYTKIGNRVYVSGYLYTENTGGSTGVTVELRDNANTNNVATLPYVPNQAGGFPITGTRTISDNYRNMAVTFRPAQSQVYIYTDDGNNAYLKNTNNVQINSAQTHLVIQFCGSYTTNS